MVIPDQTPSSPGFSQKSDSRKDYLDVFPEAITAKATPTCQMEQDVKTVIHVLQPGPIGIVEHKFTDAEILEAKATVRRAVDNWRRNWTLERNLSGVSFDKWK